MKICEKAEQDKNSQLETIAWNGAYFINRAVGMLASAPMMLFTPHRARHEWIVVTTTSGSVYCIQFAKGDECKEIIVSDHDSIAEANVDGRSGTGSSSWDPIEKERPANINTLGDLLVFITNWNQQYNIVSNNCQSLASDIYDKFADISLSDRFRQQSMENKLGVSRHPGGISIVCNVM